MPAKSKKQFKLMKAIESGSVKKPGLSPAKAAEYTSSNKGKKAFKKLPTKVKKKK